MSATLRHLLGRAALVEQRIRLLVAERRQHDPTPDDPFRGLYLSEDTVARLLDPDADADGPDALPRVLLALMRDIGMPNGLAEVGYGEADVDDLVAGSLQQQRLLATAPRDVTAEDLARVFRGSMELW